MREYWLAKLEEKQQRANAEIRERRGLDVDALRREKRAQAELDELDPNRPGWRDGFELARVVPRTLEPARVLLVVSQPEKSTYVEKRAAQREQNAQAEAPQPFWNALSPTSKSN